MANKKGELTIHKSNGNIIFWENEKNILYNMHVIERKGANEISKHYNCGGDTILRWLKFFNIYNGKERSNAFYDIDVDYFSDIKNELCGY